MNIQPFIDYIKQEKRFSEHTILSYSKDLEQFQVFCRLQYALDDISQATFQIIRSFIVHIMNEGLSAKTTNRKISTLRSYFKYLVKKEIIKSNPTSGIQGPKTPKRNPVFVPQENMNTLLDHLTFEDSFEGKRDKLILEIFYFTGMRKAELIGLKIIDIDFYESTMKVLGKRNKERIIPTSSVVMNHIKEYLTLRNEIDSEELTSELFITKQNKKLSPRQVYSIVNKYLSATTTIGKKSPHILRHTFATHMLNNGADINGIKEILGHASLAATQVYTHNSFEKLKQIHSKAHPRG